MAFEDQRTTVYKVDPEHPESETLPTLRTEELLLNMGPQHPSTHGVLKVILELEGERLVKSTPVMGFLHRGVEKLAEEGTYHQFIPHTDRLDYVCAMYNNFAYCRAVEKLMDLHVPERAEYLRTIVAEVQRIIGHQFWLGTQALDIGAMTVFFYCFRDREILLDWFDELCGARLTTSWYRIGGVERDLTPSLIQKLKQFLDYFPPKIDEYIVFLEKNRIWLARTHLAGIRGRLRSAEIRALRRLSQVRIQRAGRQERRHLRSVLDSGDGTVREREDHPAMFGADAGRAHHGRRAERHLASERAGLYESGGHDPTVQTVLAGVQRPSGGDLLRHGSAQGRAGLLHRQHGRRQTVPAENSRPLFHSHGRV
jgi:hypothetical protein